MASRQALLILLLLLLPLPVSAKTLKGEITIGVVPEMKAVLQQERYAPLAGYLSRATGRKVNIVMISRYGNILDQFRLKKIDAAFLGSFTGAVGVRQLGLRPLARPVRLDGSTTYQGYVFARNDGSIKSISDLEGKRFAFVDKATTAGYLFPLSLLRQNGFTGDLDQFIAEPIFAGSHDAAITMVLDGKADAGAAKNTVYEKLRRQNPEIDRQLVILARSVKVPSNGLLVRSDMHRSLQATLKKALLYLDRTPEGKKILAGLEFLKFVKADSAEYEPVFRLAAEAGVDLARYKYLQLQEK